MFWENQQVKRMTLLDKNPLGRWYVMQLDSFEYLVRHFLSSLDLRAFRLGVPCSYPSSYYVHSVLLCLLTWRLNLKLFKQVMTLFFLLSARLILNKLSIIRFRKREGWCTGKAAYCIRHFHFVTYFEACLEGKFVFLWCHFYHCLSIMIRK